MKSNIKLIIYFIVYLFFSSMLAYPKSALSATVFTCVQDSPEVFGCWFQVKSDKPEEVIEFELSGGQSKVLGDEIMGRRYCYSSFVDQISLPDKPKQVIDKEFACQGVDILVQKNNKNEFRFDPLPIDKIYFSCLSLFRSGCTFIFDNPILKFATLQPGEQSYLPSYLKNRKYCVLIKPAAPGIEINFDLCTSPQSKKPIFTVADRNDVSGSRNDGDVDLSVAKRSFIPPILLTDPSRVSACVTTSSPTNGETYYLMTGLFYSSEKRILGDFSGIPALADATILASLCKGKWYYQPGEDITKWEKIEDLKIPNKEGLKNELDKTIRQYNVMKNGYVLHVSARRVWNGPYVEYYFETKVSSTADPDSPPVVADDLRLDWRHQNTHDTEHCGKSSFCSKSDREYLNLSAPSDDFCAHGVSILEGIALGAETTKGKSCYQ